MNPTLFNRSSFKRSNLVFIAVAALSIGLLGCEPTDFNSDIPSGADIRQNQRDIDATEQNIDELEQEADQLIGDSVPKGEAVYEDLSNGNCTWLQERSTFYNNLAQDFSQQADDISSRTSQTAMYQQAETAAQRAAGFDKAFEQKCVP